MVKAAFLIPVKDNEDQPFPDEDFVWLREELVRRFEGFTRDRRVDGEWYEGGERFADESFRYTVVLDEERMPLLDELLRSACARFRQEALYLETARVEVRSVTPEGSKQGV